MSKRPKGAEEAVKPKVEEQEPETEEQEAPAAEPSATDALKAEVAELRQLVKDLVSRVPAGHVEPPQETDEWPPFVKAEWKVYRWPMGLMGKIVVDSGLERTDQTTGIKTLIRPPVICEFQEGLFKTNNQWIQQRIEASEDFRYGNIQDMLTVRTRQKEALERQLLVLRGQADALPGLPADQPEPAPYNMPAGASEKPAGGPDPAEFELPLGQLPPEMEQFWNTPPSPGVIPARPPVQETVIKPRLTDSRHGSAAFHPTEAQAMPKQPRNPRDAIIERGVR